MTQRLVPAILLLVLLLLHAQLWFGRGNVFNVAELQRKLDQQLASNQRTQQQIDQLHSEVDDLKTGLAVIEERARSDLGMVKQGEFFVQVSPP